MEPFVPPGVQVQLAEESQRIGPQEAKEAAIPSNIVIEEKLQALKLGSSQQELSQKGQEVAENFDKLLEDTWRLFVEKNKDEDLQKAALHASRAAQIARRNDLLSSPYGRLTLEQAMEGAYSAMGFARLLVTSAEFRDELVELIGLLQLALRRQGPVTGKTRTVRGRKLVSGPEEEEREVIKGQEEEEEQEDEVEEEGKKNEEEEEEQEEEEQDEEGGKGGEEEETQEGIARKGLEREVISPVSQNQLDMIARCLVHLFKRLQGKSDVQDSFRFLLDQLHMAVEKGTLHSDRLEQQMEESEPRKALLSETGRAKHHAIRVIESWTETSLDPLFAQLNALNDQIQNDSETRAALRDVRSFLERNLQSGKIDDEDAVVQETKGHVDRMRRRLLAKYNERVCRLVEELSYIRDTLKENETAEILQHDIQHLARSIVYDSQGQPTISSDLVNDLEVLFGTLLRKVQFIPIPRIAVVTNNFDFACDDIVLNLRELTPKQIQLESLTNIHNLESEQSEYTAIRGVSAAAEGAPEPVGLETFVRIYLREIHADLPGISWYFNKKGGMIQDHDRGKADIKIYGKGMSVDLDVQPGLPIATEDRPVAHTLEVKQCKATIHRMSLRLYDARHDWLYTVFHPYIKGQVRRAIESSVGRYLKAYVTNIDRNATIAAVGHYPATRHIMVSSKQEQKEHQEHYRGHEKEQLGATIQSRSARTVRPTSVGEDDVPQIHRLVEEEGFERQGGRLSPFEEGPA